MGWSRQDDFHSSRVYGADEPAGSGILSWLQRQFDRLLRDSNEPGPATVLLTHALDDQLSALEIDRGERQRTAFTHKTRPGNPPR